MRVLPLVALFVLLNVPVSAEVRTLLVVPINFQNDTSQPRTQAQLKADADTLVAKTFGAQNTYGVVTVTTTVVNYLTLPMDKGCNLGGATLPALNLGTFLTNVSAGLAARGETTSGFTYVYYVSPTTFVKCSHTDRYGFAFDKTMASDEHAMMWLLRLGLRLSINWLCRAAAGSSTYVTLSAFCGPSPSTANGRDFTSLTGQGGGSLCAADRARLGWLPAEQQTTVTATTGQWTLTRIENPAAGTKRLLIPALGVELEYHAQNTSIGWDTRGVTGHVINTSNRIDFTPDDRWLFGTTALAAGASWTYNGLRLTTISADLNAAIVDLRPTSEPAPTDPPPIVVPPPPPPPVTPPVTPPPTDTTGYQGCRKDTAASDGKRVLPSYVSIAGLTIAKCLAAIKAKGLTYAGVEHGNECYGGNVLPPIVSPESECNSPCAGDTSVKCGGGWRLSVYTAQ